MNVRIFSAILPLIASLACSAPETSGQNNAKKPCVGKCDANNTSSKFIASLEGRDDPMAAFLRANADEYGTLPGDYATVLDGVGQELGCDASTEKTFVILLSNKSNFPRNIVTRCSDSPRNASKFFLSTQSDDGALGDINPRDFKAAVWDAKADRYNLYEFKAEEGPDGPLYAYVEPKHCATCHTAPSNLDAPDLAFAPIMNELTNPWTLWNAEPDFRSHHFDDLLDPEVSRAPVYSAMLEGDRLGSAATFETIIRSALDRVAKARVDIRKEATTLDASLGLLRPLFCDENLNYASENLSTDQIQTDVLVDDGIRQMLVELRGYEWPQDFVHEDRHRFASPEDGEARVEVMPSRSAAAVLHEKRLVTRRVLTAQQVLRLRALDWQRPVFSELRCGLFLDGAQRLKASTPDLTEYPTNADYLPVLFDTLMHISTPDGLVSLTPEGDDTLFSIPDAEEASEVLATGELSSYEVDHDTFASELDTYLTSLSRPGARTLLEAERVRRGCQARAHFPSAPDIPNLSCD